LSTIHMPRKIKDPQQDGLKQDTGKRRGTRKIKKESGLI
jgi:hypothetical protein